MAVPDAELQPMDPEQDLNTAACPVGKLRPPGYDCGRASPDPRNTRTDPVSESTASEAADNAEATPAPAARLEPFTLQKGARIELGHRTGKVLMVRGSGTVPYDVQVRWEGSKRPEWLIYRSLAVRYERGELKILKQGKGTLMQRICPWY